MHNFDVAKLNDKRSGNRFMTKLPYRILNQIKARLTAKPELRQLRWPSPFRKDPTQMINQARLLLRVIRRTPFMTRG